MPTSMKNREMRLLKVEDYLCDQTLHANNPWLPVTRFSGSYAGMRVSQAGNYSVGIGSCSFQVGAELSDSTSS